MKGKTELTRESIVRAIADGAKSLTQVAHAHGYVGSVSSGTTARIRALVPEVAERLAGTYVEPAAVVVPQRKGYRGLYGAAFELASGAGEVVVREFLPVAANAVATDPRYAPVVAKIKERHGDADLVAQLTKALTFAFGVIRTAKHQSNMNRSKDVSEKRGCMHVVAC